MVSGRSYHFGVLRYSCVLLAMSVMAGCGNAVERIDGLDAPPTTGTLSVTVAGLPGGTPASVRVTGPGGFAQSLSATQTIAALLLGTYTVHADPVAAMGHGWAPAQVDQSIVVTGSSPSAFATIDYSVTTGALTVIVTGLPAGVPAGLIVSGNEFSQPVIETTSLAGLSPGLYAISGTAITVGTAVYDPIIEADSVLVLADTIPVTSPVVFQRRLGTISVEVGGLPAGVGGALVLSGPGGFELEVTVSAVLDSLDPGSYSLSASPVAHLGNTWTPTPSLEAVEIDTGTVALEVTYVLSTGGLAVAVGGLPEGVQAAVTVTGPDQFGESLTESGAWVGITPGDYSVTATPVLVGNQTFTPDPLSQIAPVLASTTPALATVTYRQSTGDLTVTVSGLPSGTPAAIAVTGPDNFAENLTGSGTLSALEPGAYSIIAAPVPVGTQVYSPTPLVQSVTVEAGATPAGAAVAYAPTTGWLSISVWGLPGGVGASVLVTGPGGFSQTITGPITLSGLLPGAYLLSASTVSGGGQSYAPSPLTQAISVTAGATSSASVTYGQSTGDLAVTVSGLPGGVLAAITVTGPGGYTQSLTAAATLTGLTPGTYTVAAVTVSGGGQAYAPSPLSQPVTVILAATASATVTYTVVPGGPSLNLRVDGLYLTQAAQRYDGSTPLVAGRDAYLRVFGLANEANAVAPTVRIRLYAGALLVQTYTVPAPAGSVPMVVSEGSLTSSWNALVPGALLQPGLSVLADVDPADAVVEADESDNHFPVSGTPIPVDVRALPTFDVRFVPVLQQVNGLQGDVTPGNAEQYLVDAKKWLPVGAYASDVRGAYTTNAPALQSNDANGAWGTILSEVLALRAVDGSSQYYYGVVKTSYSSGVAGMGYVGGGARTGIGWDYLPSGSSVMAHEVGHNMGRWHAPCGGAGNPDPSYPYAGGSIGIWGLDVQALALKNPATHFDFMGYCNPDWVSDYNWSAMLSYRQSGPNNLAAASTGHGLLVWGRITDQGPILEPAFVVDAPVVLPSPGPYRFEALGSDGTVLSSRSFTAVSVEDSPASEAAFAFVVPLDRVLELEMTALRITTPAGRVERRAMVAGAPNTVVQRTPTGRAVLRWNSSSHPMVMVRDAASGGVLSFARGGRLVLPAGIGAIELTYTDGVRSLRESRILR